MLLYSGVEMERIQCAFIGNDEIAALTDAVGKQIGYQKSYNTPYYLPEPAPEEGDEGGGGLVDMKQLDERFEEAARLIVTSQRGSTSDLQRRLGMGYAKAGRVMDQLASAWHGLCKSRQSDGPARGRRHRGTAERFQAARGPGEGLQRAGPDPEPLYERRTMKRIVTGLAAILLSLSAFAQGGIPILDRPMTQVTDGDVVVEDNAYLLSGLGLEVRSDGTTRWSMDRAAEEVLIETVEKEDLFTNPALFINSYKGYMDKIRVNGSSSNSLDVTLVLDEDTSARFVLKNIVFEDKQGKSDFTLNVKSLPDSYVITDLR